MTSSKERQVSQQRKVLIFESGHALTDYLIKQWAEIAQEAVQRSGRFTVALSGGRSPVEFYCKLSSLEDFDLWQKTHIFLGDERFVPLDDDASNFKVIKTNLLDYITIPPENIHPIPTDQKNVDLSAEQYKGLLAQFFEFGEANVPCFDLILLGIGSDGHTASLFPDDKQIDDAKRLVLPVSLPHLKYERISVTLPVINNARNVFFLALGANKADILKEIIENEGCFPASKVKPAATQPVYLLDKEAAQKLSFRDSYFHEGQAISLIEPELTEE